jgi:hypothetical protein
VYGSTVKVYRTHGFEPHSTSILNKFRSTAVPESLHSCVYTAVVRVRAAIVCVHTAILCTQLSLGPCRVSNGSKRHFYYDRHVSPRQGKLLQYELIHVHGTKKSTQALVSPAAHAQKGCFCVSNGPVTPKKEGFAKQTQVMLLWKWFSDDIA